MSDNATCFQAYRFYSSCCLEDTRRNHHSSDFRAVTLSTSIIDRGHFVSCNSGRKCSDNGRSLEESSPQDTFLSSFIRFGIYWPLYRSRHPPCRRCSRIDFLKEFLRNRKTTVIPCLRKAPYNSLWKLFCFLNYNTCESNVNRPFYSCVLSCLAKNASESRGDLALIQTSLLFSSKCKLVSIRTTWFTQQKQWGLYQSKVNSSLATIQKPGHSANNWKMVYWKTASRAHGSSIFPDCSSLLHHRACQQCPLFWSWCFLFSWVERSWSSQQFSFPPLLVRLFTTSIAYFNVYRIIRRHQQQVQKQRIVWKL